MNTEKKIKVLLEMRPAFEGFAGIPQEVRLLYRGLNKIESLTTEGMIQSSAKVLSRGTKENSIFADKSETKRINRFSKAIISLSENPHATIKDAIYWFIARKMISTTLVLRGIFFNAKINLTKFESKHFGDFVWRSMFSKTLPASDYDVVTKQDFWICSVPWQAMHAVGLNLLNFAENPYYATLNTKRFDVFIGQTPYPGRVSKNTAYVIRYHDAIPVFMPHTIPEKSKHQATHFYALQDNIKHGAWFACVSEATRADLIRLFPAAEKKAVTIHNMVSHHYYNENSSRALISGIIRARLYEASGFLPAFFSMREKESFYSKNLFKKEIRYLMMVSTIEPRKNHTRLLAAWEAIKADIDPDIKLVIVGTLGWDNSAITSAFKPWIDRGELFMLNAVPAPDLRALYHHAAATVCPSLGEGFDFSGVEAMASGGVTIASDIPVHREIYDDAALYFDPYSTASLIKAIKAVLYDDGAQEQRKQMVTDGQEVSKRYQPEVILPRWEQFIDMITNDKRGE